MLAIYQFWFRISLFFVFNHEEKQEGTCWSIGYDLRNIPAEKRVPLWFGGKFCSHAACCRAGGTDLAPELLPQQIEHQSWPSERRGGGPGGPWGLWGICNPPPPRFYEEVEAKPSPLKGLDYYLPIQIFWPSYGPIEHQSCQIAIWAPRCFEKPQHFPKFSFFWLWFCLRMNEICNSFNGGT